MDLLEISKSNVPEIGNISVGFENTTIKNISDTTSLVPPTHHRDYSDVISNCTEVITDSDLLYEKGKVQIEF
jgi:hypothetical protein